MTDIQQQQHQQRRTFDEMMYNPVPAMTDATTASRHPSHRTSPRRRQQQQQAAQVEEEEEELAKVVVFSANVLASGFQPKQQDEDELCYRSAEELYDKLERLHLLRRISTEQAMMMMMSSSDSDDDNILMTADQRQQQMLPSSGKTRKCKNNSSSSSSKRVSFAPSTKSGDGGSITSPTSTLTPPSSAFTSWASAPIIAPAPAPAPQTAPASAPISAPIVTTTTTAPTTILPAAPLVVSPPTSPATFSKRRNYPILPSTQSNKSHRRSVSLDDNDHQIGLFNRSSSRSLMIEANDDDPIISSQIYQQHKNDCDESDHRFWNRLRRKLGQRKHQLP